MFSTFYTPCQQLSRRAHLIVATLLSLAIGFSVAYAQQLESEFTSPLHVTDSPSVLFDKGLVELQVDDDLLQEMSVTAGKFLLRDFPVNEHETIDLVIERFFPYRGDIHEAYFVTDKNGNRVVRKRPVEITALCFRGQVSGYPESLVVFGISKDMCNGFIEYGETKHTLSTDPATGVVVVSDPLAEQPGLQIVREMMREAVVNQGDDQGNFRGLDNSGNDEPTPGGCAQISLSVAYGADFLDLFVDEDAASDYIVTLIGQVSEIFHRDGVIWADVVVAQITPGGGIVDTSENLADELCNFVEVAVGGQYPDPTLATGNGASDGVLILRTTADGTLNIPNADLTKQSLAYFGGLTTGITPAFPEACPDVSVLNAVAAASGLIGATDTTGYDTYIVAQALGTLCGASPTGVTPAITALIGGPFGPAPSGAGTNLVWDNCDGGAPATPIAGTIMSSCILPVGSTMAANIDVRLNTTNAIAMNAFLTAPPGPLVNGGALVPAPIVTVAGTQGGAGNCTSVNITWTPDPAATAEYVFRNVTNSFASAQLLATLPGGTGNYRDNTASGSQIYRYWVVSTNACNIDDPFLIADQYNPLIAIMPPTIPITYGQGVPGNTGGSPPPLTQVMATVYESCDTITVTWDLSLPIPGGYPTPLPDIANIFRNTVDVPPGLGSVPIASVAMSLASYSDNDPALIQDTTYYYWVTPSDSNCDVPDPPVVGDSATGILQPDISGEAIRAGATNNSFCTGVIISWVPDPTLLGLTDKYEIKREDVRFPGVPQTIHTITPPHNNGVPITQWTDFSAEPGVQYEYWVIATNVCSESSMAVDGALGMTAELERPLGVQVIETDPADPTTPACGNIEIRWDEVMNADAYEVWRSTIDDYFNTQTPPTSIGTTTDLFFVDSPPVSGQIYYYWVASVSNLCPAPLVIPLSTTVFGSAFAKLVQPTNLTASKGTDCDQIHVEWDGDFDGTTYIVSRNTVDTFATAEVVGEIDDLGYFHDPLDGDGSQPDPVAGTQYYYWVEGSNECGDTVESNSDSGSLGVLLEAPFGLDATEGTFCPGIQVSWVPRVLADKYRIYRDTAPNPNPDDSLYIGETLVGSSSTYNDATAIPGYSYYYWVEAVSNCSIGAPILQDEPAEGMHGALAGPTGVSATNGTTCGFVELSWDEVPLASNYVVWSSLDDVFGNATVVGTTPIPLFQDDLITDKTLTYYWVTTDTQFCTGTVQSAGVSGWALTEVAVVTGIVAGQGSECSELLVTWNPVDNIIQYDVYRNETGVEPDPAIDVPVTTTEAIYLDADAANFPAGTEFYYWVRATTSCGVSDDLGVVAMGYLAEDNLTAPLGVGQADSTSCSTILIEWQPVDSATGYDVYRGVTDEFGESAFQGNTISSPYSDANVTDGQTYFYWTKATNACGDSAESASASGVTLTLNSPVITDISLDQCGVVNMSWDAIADVDEYHVYYSQDPNPFNPPANYLGTTTATEFTDAAPLLDTPLYYWVLSVVDHNNLFCVSQWGSYATGMALAPTSPPHDVHASVNEFCNIIRLNWISNNIGATSHSIHRHDTDDVTLSQLIGTTSETQFDDLGDVVPIVQGTTYYYWVKSATSCEESDFGLGTSGWTQVPPVNPTNVNATDTGTSTSCATVDIGWQQDPTADTYLVWRSPVDVNNPLQIAETNLTNFQDSVVEPGGIYTYWVTSKNNCGQNDVEIGVTISDDGSLGQLVPPLNVSATDGGGACGQIDVSWDTVPLASGYKVYRSDTTDFAGALLVGAADSNAFTDVGTTIYPMDYDTPYYYFVQSVNQFCQYPSTHSPAEVGHALPSHTIPTGVTATLGTSCENIWINWTVGPNDQYYDIYRNQTGVEPDPETVPPTYEEVSLPPYVDNVGAGDTNTYYYWVRAVNSCPGFSDLSENTSGFATPVLTDSPSASATQGTHCLEVEVSWDQLQSAVVYHIYRNVTDDSATANNIAEGEVITTSPWQDVNALAGQTYFYWVTAENDCGESPKDANGQQGWIGVTAQPSSVDASDDGCNMTTISWSAVFDATQYDVYRNTANDFSSSTWVGSTDVTTLDDSGAAPAVEYYYWVTASSANCGESSPSSSVTGYSLPGIEIPTNVVATQESLCDEIRLTWDASNQNVVTTYTIYRSPDSDIANRIQLSPTTTDTTFLDDDPLLVAGIQYYYWVTGTNSCGTSPDSIVASGTAGDGADSPTIVTATDSGLSSFCNQVVITWAASSGATSYMVYRNVVDDADTAEWIGTTLWPMYIDSSALPATTYYYWVTSVTSCGESLRDDVDNSDSGSLGQLAPPDDLLTSDPDFVGCGSVELTWTPVEYATAYYVYRSTTPTYPGAGGLIGLAEGDTYLDNLLNQSEFNVPLYYWLESVGEYCDSPATHSQLAEGLARPPLVAPTTVRSSDGTVCNEVWIDWDEDVNALYFHVYRNTVEDYLTADLLTDPATAPTTNVYVDSSAFDPDTDYYYWVRTVNTCGTSSYSNSDIGYPADIPSSPIVSVTQGSICDSITLNWGTIPTANRYQIFRSEIEDEEFPQYIAEVLTPITTWTDVNVIPDVDYYYWVASLNDCTTSGTDGDGNRGWIGELAVPTNVQASQLEFCGNVTITWDTVDNAVNYNLYRKLVDASGEDPTLSELIGNSDGATSFVDSDINPSNQYYYWVKAVNYTICGESDFSSSSIGQSLPPVIVPSEVNATVNEQCGQITITWVHDETLTTYTVLRNTADSVGGAVVVATNLPDTTFVDTEGAGEGQPFESGVPYFYWVVANNACGDSDYSQPAALGQAGDDPAQPTGLTASPSCNAVILNWTQVEGASSYQLVRRTSPTSTATIVYEGNQTTHTDLEVVLGLTYYYSATASNSCSTSSESDQSSSSATGAPPPTGVSATDGTLNCQVSVTWDSVEDATNYRIYRGTDSDVTNTDQIGQEPQSPFIDPSPLPSAYYFVRAITPGCGEGGFSTGDIGSPFEGLPNPGGVSASNGTVCGGITISWDAVSGASTYCVYRSVSEGPQTATQQACGISGLSWLDDDVTIGVPYWYWVTSEFSGDESCNLGIPDQGVSSEPLGGIQNLTASQCEPNYIEVEWYGVNACFDVKRGSTVIATCAQDPYIDFDATGTHNYYVRPRNSCGELGAWEGPVVGILASCNPFELPEGLLGTDPGDPMIIIVPSEINNPSKRKGPSVKGTTNGDSESIVNGDDPSIAPPPWSLCLVGDAEITTNPIFNLGESKWSLPLGGNWRLVGREGYADLFFLGGSDWEHVRSLRVEEIESGIAQSLLEDGIAAVVGTVPEAGTDVLITGVSPEDCDKDGIPDGCEILLGLSRDLNIDGVPDSCAADINADGIVDSLDLLEVLEHFGASINMYGDVTGDGVVDQSDVLAVLMEMSY